MPGLVLFHALYSSTWPNITALPVVLPRRLYPEPMDVRDGFVEAVGNTPLIKLRKASALTGCTVLGKAEFMNPGGSVKDRPGRQMILEAEKRGELKPGGLVVEGTAGNTR